MSAERLQKMPLSQISTDVKDEAAMVALGGVIGNAFSSGAVVFLEGELGAGKTTLSRGIIQGLGHAGAVKSPTYTLVEPYELAKLSVYHFDLYRLADPEELEYMGIREYFAADSLCLIEWPERGAGEIPNPDVKLDIKYQKQGRQVNLAAYTEKGVNLLQYLQSELNIE